MHKGLAGQAGLKRRLLPQRDIEEVEEKEPPSTTSWLKEAIEESFTQAGNLPGKPGCDHEWSQFSYIGG